MSQRREAVEAHRSPIAMPLYEGDTAGVAFSGQRMAGIPDSIDHGWLSSALTRVGTRAYWKTNGTGRLTLRFLKERRGSYPGGVPAAGPDAA